MKLLKELLESDLTKYIVQQRAVKLAVLGFVCAIIFSFTLGTEKSTHESAQSPNPIPFKESICGNGIVEANTKNIYLGVFQPGIVNEILVKEGDVVKKGDVLLRMDDRLAQTSVYISEANLKIAEADFKAAKTNYEEPLDQLQRARQMTKDVISGEELKKREFAHDRTQALMAAAEMKLYQAKQSLENAKVTLEQTKIIAPVDGTILKIYPPIGEYISNADNIMIMGNISPLYLKVQIDETDVPYFDPTSKAVAVQRSIKSDPIPLAFVKIDPIVISKTNLRGTSSELVDTRVIEVTYALPEIRGIYIGQLIDAYVEKRSTQN